MSADFRINAADSINSPGANASDITATTSGTKRGMDVSIISDSSSVVSVNTQTIYNEAIASANTEQSLALPASIIGYMIKSRGAGEIKLSHVATESGTNFITINGNFSYVNKHTYSNLTLYFQSPTAGEIVEVVVWE